MFPDTERCFADTHRRWRISEGDGGYPTRAQFVERWLEMVCFVLRVLKSAIFGPLLGGSVQDKRALFHSHCQLSCPEKQEFYGRQYLLRDAIMQTFSVSH